MDLIRIHLLGGFLIEHRGQALPPIPSTVGRSLFAYLVASRGRMHTRDLLAGTFWPELAEAAARRRLSQALWQINTALQDAEEGDALIETTPSHIGFRVDGNFSLDIAEFDDHLEEATMHGATGAAAEVTSLQSAVALYRGEFLAGFYDDWATVERERLRGAYLESLSRLIALHKSRSEYETALSFARRLTLHDPLREEAHREVMRLCFLLGRNNEALKQYERCVAVLSEELGTAPDAETTSLQRSIAQLRDKGERPFAPTAEAPLLDLDRPIPLVGRDEERLVVLRRLEETLRGRGGVVMIEGPSGIGKTRLIEEVSEDAQWRGLSVLIATAEEDKQLHAFHAIRTAIESGLTRLRAQQLAELLHDATLADLGRIVPRIRDWLPTVAEPASAAPGSRERAVNAVRQTLAVLAELNPLVLIIDDAQWADDESIALLDEVTGDLRDVGLLFCLSYRGAEARERADLWNRLTSIDATTRADRVELAALDLAEATRLVEESLGGATVPGEMSEGLFLETGGNPLFVLETLRTWHAETRQRLGIDVTPTDLVGGEALPVSGGIAYVIARRFAGLDDTARAVLEIAAVEGSITDPGGTAAIGGFARMDTLQALETLIRRGAMVETDDGYVFAHYQIRKVTLDGLTPDRKAGLHLAVAEATERRRPHRVEDLAYHFTAAGAAEKAVEYSAQAGERALELAAFDTAARHFANAASWDAVSESLAVLTQWETALDVLGRRHEQTVVLDRAEPVTSEDGERADLARRRARLAAHDGNYRLAVELAEGAVDLMPVTDPGRVDALRTLGMVVAQSGRPDAAIETLREAATAAAAADPSTEAAALCDLGNVLCDAQRYEESVASLERALQLYDEVGDIYGTAETSGQLAIVRMEQGEAGKAADMYRTALSQARDLGYQRGEAVNLANLGNALYVQGEVDAALASYQSAADLFTKIGDRRGSALLRANAASVRHTVVGDDSVEPDVLESLDFFRSEGHLWGQAFCHEHLAAIAARRGDIAEARRHVIDGIDLLADGSNRWVEVHLRRLGALIDLDAGDVPAATEHITIAGDVCLELGLRHVAPTVESVHALVELAAGNDEAALGAARAATELLETGAERPYVVWHRRAIVERSLGNHEQAVTAVGRAMALLEDIVESLGAEDRKRSLEQVPDHAKIVADYRQSFPVLETVQLPGRDVPTGRPLRDEDLVEVRWTVWDPSDLEVAELGERRRVRVLRIASEATAQGGAARIEDLAGALDVSIATVRRDLGTLRSAGHEIPMRGRR